MQEVKGITIADAFKALEDIDDIQVKDEVEKIQAKKKLKESLKEEKKVIKLDVSGDHMYDKGQAYYYARTGDKVDYRGNKYTIDQDDTHKIGYSDTILLKGDDGKTIEVAKKDFVKDAALLKEEAIEESQDDYWVLSDGKNPKNSNVFSSIDNLDDVIAKLEQAKGDEHWELLHYVNGTTKKVWDTENGRMDEECELKEEPYMEPEYDSRKSFYKKAYVDERPDGTKILYSYGTPVCKIEDGKAILLRKGYLSWACSPTTLRHVKEFLRQNGFEAGSINDLRKNYPEQQATYNEALTLTEGILVDLLDKDEVEEGKKFIKDEEEHIEQVVDVDADTVEELKDSYVGNVLLRCPICKTPIFKKPELLEKEEDSDIYNVGETCPHCGSKDGFELVGQIATMDVPQPEPTPTTGKDEVESTSATLEDEVTDNEVGEKDEEEVDAEKKAVEAEVTKEEDEEENKRPSVMAKESLELKGLSEDTFSTLVNRYLEATYNNVEGYKINSCELEDKKLVVEGTLKFKSGKEKDTKFVLEGKVGKNNKKLRFVGMNETFSKSKRTFNLTCRNEDGNLVCESLAYGYKANDKDIKGKIKI